MATGMLLEFQGFTKEHYDQVNDALNLGENPIEGLILHTSGPTPAGWRVYDIWESTGAFERFAEERLMPTLQEAGLGDESGAAPQFSELHNIYAPDPDELARLGATALSGDRVSA